ncbi:hypothetical protein SAMN05421812_113188 [Asanoa hainanensis]|uniref:Uncharacterized protein n=1 Tax=Asanoa hainanensis TaxID=560556 RepID=A0A239P3Y7_9ACTN|nr:hypothetical protein [Asanoa hainanensis]SNT61750.1 hypothetical protein SAMN05421812_113188 [Asanoa hainanensis]
MQALVGTLTETEQGLVRETSADQLAPLDEDELVALHTRVRRARDKYVKLYRRQSATRVRSTGARGKAHPRGSRDRDKAEVFEEALARVSRRLATAARAAARAFKAERIAEARAATFTPPPVPPSSGGRRNPRGDQVADRSQRTPDRLKRHATTRAATKRAQSRKDSR